MSRERAALLRYALSLPSATLDHPWGEDVIKVRGKVFIFLGIDDPRSDFLMGVKLARSLLYARSRRNVEAMGYGLGRSGWCTVKRLVGAVDLALMKEWIAESYENVAPGARVRAGTVTRKRR